MISFDQKIFQIYIDWIGQRYYYKNMLLGYIDPGSGFNFTNSSAWLLYFLASLSGLIFLYIKKIWQFFKKHWKLIITILLFIAVIGAILGGYMLRNKTKAIDKKVIILGFDGISPAILEQMMANNQLPNFQRLKSEGTYKKLKTTNPSQSPVAWAAFITGKNPGENGIYDFIIRDRKTSRLDLSMVEIKGDHAKSRLKAKPFWYYTSRLKIPSVIIDAPVSFPPDKIYGRILSGLGTPDILGTEGTFTFYTTESKEKHKDTGGNTFFVRKKDKMLLNLIGPRVSHFETTKNATVPFEAQITGDNLTIRYSGKTIQLKPKGWSDWQSVEFEVAPFKKMYGIFKFYLVSANPELNLYITPIQIDPRKPFFPLSYPRNYSAELADSIGLFYTQGMPSDVWAVCEKRLDREAFLEQSEDVLN